MKSIIHIARLLVLTLLTLTSSTALTFAQNVSIPDPGLNAAVREALQKPAGPLTQADLLGLNLLSACCRDIKSLQGLEAARNLSILDLHSNSLTNGAVLNSLTNLQILDLFQNRLTSFVLPGARANLTIVDLAFNSLTQCSLPGGLTNLDTIFLEGNQLTNLTLPAGLTKLTQLDLSGNALSSFAFPADMTNLILPSDITKLGFLDVGDNQLSSLSLPAGLSELNFLRLSGNRLANFSLPAGMTNLSTVFLRSNQLSSLTLSPGLTHLVQMDVMGNQLTNLTLLPDMTQLVTLGFEGNPLTTLVLSEPLAATNLAASVALLRNQDVPVFTYPLEVRLVRPLELIGAFKLGIKGPPGTYTVLGSSNLADWSVIRAVANPLGSVNFVEATSNQFPVRFYRALRQTPPPNMVFIPPNTFTMGSPTNEVGHQTDEGPQTMVTLSRGFWIGKYEVTQGEYLAVTGENPSGFPGDLNRPVESVSFFAASNYCFLLTAQDQATGRILPGSHYRLPTEAEWECAARAGTSTRFSYGDDPDLTGLSNFAWFGARNGITTHPVGQKLPNAWGLYDMAGNVWEWCQDWYGTYPGGAVTDPQGPSTNPIGWKVIRGGAWEASEFDCRSASRWFEGASPFISDFIIGFRVVLVTEP